MKDKEKIQKLKSVAAEKYENVDLDHLAVYAIGELEKVDADLSFENAVIASFKLFPKKFSLLGFPDYPDSLRVYTCLWRCSTDKKKLWLGGKIRQGFVITERTRKIISQAENLLEGLSLRKTKAPSKTRRKEVFMADLERSPAYSKYINGQTEAISRADVCYLLQGTLDSSQQILRNNFDSLKKFAEELDREDVLKFLSWLEKKFKYYVK